MNILTKGRRCRLLSLTAAALIATFLITGCAVTGSQSESNANEASGNAETIEVTDMIGRTVEVPTHVDRVVGLGPGSLRLLTYLDCVEQVVGVELSEQTDEIACPYRHVNQSTFANLPVIGDGGSKGVTPNEEALLQVGAQVIFANIDKDSADTLQQRTGIPVVCLTAGELVFDQDFYTSVELVGKVMGKSERAEEIITYMNGAESDLMERSSGAVDADGLTAYVGGVNYRGGHGFDGTEAVFAPFLATNTTNIADSDGLSGAYNIDLEIVSAAQPDFIFLESINLPLIGEDYKNSPDYFNSLEAVQKDRVNTLLSYRFYATNVELALANCYQVGSIMHPEAFADIDPNEKLDEIARFFLGADLSEELAANGYEYKNVDLSQLA